MKTVEVFGDLDMVQFCTRLRQARAQRGLTQTQLAWQANMSVFYYNNIERGRKSGLTANTLYKLCQVLRVRSDWLLGLPDMVE